MIVLTREAGEAEKLAEGAPGLQRKFGMPIHPEPYPRTASSEPACRAVVAARLNAPQREDALLRALRVRTMGAALLDDPALIDAAAVDAGIDPAELAGGWRTRRPARGSRRTPPRPALRRPRPGRSTTSSAARPGNAATRRRATRSTEADGRIVVVPGFNQIEAYEVAIANLEPELERRPAPRGRRRAARLGALSAGDGRGHRDHRPRPGDRPLRPREERRADPLRGRLLLATVLSWTDVQKHQDPPQFRSPRDP